MKATPELVM